MSDSTLTCGLRWICAYVNGSHCKSPQSAFRAVCRIGPSVSPIHSASDSSRAHCTLCICCALVCTILFVVECTCTIAFHIVSVTCCQ